MSLLLNVEVSSKSDLEKWRKTMKLVDKFEPEVIVLDLSNDQHIFGGKLKEKDINTRRSLN